MSSAARDFYAILGLGEEAGPEELRRAYLALAVKYHPDRNSGDPAAEERFKDISQAYAVLSDPAARARYDRLRRRTGAAESAPSGAGPTAAGASAERPSPEAGEGEGRAEADFEDILAGFFKSVKGREILNDLAAELKKAGFDFKAEDLTAWLRKGKTAAAGVAQKSFWAGVKSLFQGARPEGGPDDLVCRLPLPPGEAGRVVKISLAPQGRPLEVRLPADLKDGDRLRLPGEGHLKADGGRGDLIIVIKKTA